MQGWMPSIPKLTRDIISHLRIIESDLTLLNMETVVKNRAD